MHAARGKKVAGLTITALLLTGVFTATAGCSSVAGITETSRGLPQPDDLYDAIVQSLLTVHYDDDFDSGTPAE